MPAKQKGPSNGGWGISWQDVGVAHDEHQLHHNCTIEWSTYRYPKYRKAERMIWSVVAYARWRRDTPNEIRGWGSCEVGTSTGAASMPGAYLTAMLRAVDDLENRRSNPLAEQEILFLPGRED